MSTVWRVCPCTMRIICVEYDIDMSLGGVVIIVIIEIRVTSIQEVKAYKKSELINKIFVDFFLNSSCGKNSCVNTIVEMVIFSKMINNNILF